MNILESSPCLVGDVLYVGSGDYHVYALKLSNATAVTSDITMPLAWTTMVFDISVVSVWIAALAVIAHFVYEKRKDKRKEKSSEAPTEAPWYSTHLNQIIALTILVFAVLCYVGLNATPTWAADEKTYSQMAYHMATSGDYLYPWAFGGQAIWAGKPPLLMWLMSFSYQFLGYSNFASRVWMPLFGVASLVTVFFLGKKLYNRWVGALSVLVLGTFGIFYSFSTHAMTDGPLLFFILASIYYMLLSEDSKHPYRYAAVSGVFFGLALMTKQIEALLVPLILIVYFLVTKKSLRFLFTKRFTLSWGVGAAVFLPYVAYMAQRFRDFWDCYFLYSDFNRIVSPIEGHNGDYLFYFNYLIANEPVWTLVLPFAVGFCIYNIAAKRSKADVLILGWIVIVLALFTFAQTKLYWYVLPAVPAFALAIANLLYQAGVKIGLYRNRRKASA
jgi:4-amino-4-deoxy-L-arabinose transferase-like glycosyltransferase